MALLAAAYPALLPLLPAAVATLCLIQAAGGHDSGHHRESLPEAAAEAAAAAGGSAATAGFALTASGPKQQQHKGKQAEGAEAEAAAPPRRGAWHALSEAALAAAGVKRGELALHLGRHFSLRDVFKWCGRMVVSERGWLARRHGGLVGGWVGGCGVGGWFPIARGKEACLLGAGPWAQGTSSTPGLVRSGPRGCL